MLTLRKRGRVYHIRGTVRVGKHVRVVQEHSTGCDTEGAAEAYRIRLEGEIQEELLFGPRQRAQRVTFAEAGQRYLVRPQGLAPGDVERLADLNEILGDLPITELMGEAGWPRFIRERCQGLAPATIDRFGDVLRAALNAAAEELGYAPPKIKRLAAEGRRVRFLTAEQADHLIECYAEHVRPVIRLFRYQGARTQEALQLQWPHVDFPRATLFFERTKNGEPRTVPMHPAVAQELEAIWLKRGKPDLGHVFLNRLGKPYADTRDRLWPGGNPLAKAHATAIARMAKRRTPLRPNGGEDFRIHDWRHHWASHCVMSGMDLLTLKRLGGWKTLRMVERYADVSVQHMAEAIARVR